MYEYEEHARVNYIGRIIIKVVSKWFGGPIISTLYHYWKLVQLIIKPFDWGKWYLRNILYLQNKIYSSCLHLCSFYNSHKKQIKYRPIYSCLPLAIIAIMILIILQLGIGDDIKQRTQTFIAKMCINSVCGQLYFK